MLVYLTDVSEPFFFCQEYPGQLVLAIRDESKIEVTEGAIHLDTVDLPTRSRITTMVSQPWQCAKLVLRNHPRVAVVTEARVEMNVQADVTATYSFRFYAGTKNPENWYLHLDRDIHGVNVSVGVFVPDYGLPKQDHRQTIWERLNSNE